MSDDLSQGRWNEFLILVMKRHKVWKLNAISKTSLAETNIGINPQVFNAVMTVIGVNYDLFYIGP